MVGALITGRRGIRSWSPAALMAAARQLVSVLLIIIRFLRALCGAFVDCVDYRGATSGSQRLPAICSRCEHSKACFQ
jgi:hypothetical protein